MLRRANQGALRCADAIVAGRAGDPRRAQAEFEAGDQLLAPVSWWQRFIRMIALEAAVSRRLG